MATKHESRIVVSHSLSERCPTLVFIRFTKNSLNSASILIHATILCIWVGRAKMFKHILIQCHRTKTTSTMLAASGALAASRGCGSTKGSPSALAAAAVLLPSALVALRCWSPCVLAAGTETDRCTVLSDRRGALLRLSRPGLSPARWRFAFISLDTICWSSSCTSRIKAL